MSLWKKPWGFRSASILLACLVLAAGCGGDNEEQGAGLRPLRWDVYKAIGSRKVRLVGQVPYCAGAPEPRVDRAVIHYAGRRVLIKLWMIGELPTKSTKCLGSLLSVFRTVKLKRDLDELKLFDASVQPPKRRYL